MIEDSSTKSCEAGTLSIAVLPSPCIAFCDASERGDGDSQWGEVKPSTVLALKIAKVFGKPVEEIFTLEESD